MEEKAGNWAPVGGVALSTFQRVRCAWPLYFEHYQAHEVEEAGKGTERQDRSEEAPKYPQSSASPLPSLIRALMMFGLHFLPSGNSRAPLSSFSTLTAHPAPCLVSLLWEDFCNSSEKTPDTPPRV